MFFRFDPARLITKCLLCGFAAITTLVCIGALFPDKGDTAPQSSNALPSKQAEQPMPNESASVKTVRVFLLVVGADAAVVDPFLQVVVEPG